MLYMLFSNEIEIPCEAFYTVLEVFDIPQELKFLVKSGIALISQRLQFKK